MICSILTRARSIFLMMSSTVAVQMKGLGFWVQACLNSSIASFKSGTLTKLPRRGDLPDLPDALLADPRAPQL
ncbi:MAG: hypothetical protein ACREYE_04755, partial [Gammaproteobacteria bacterium]